MWFFMAIGYQNALLIERLLLFGRRWWWWRHFKFIFACFANQLTSIEFWQDFIDDTHQSNHRRDQVWVLFAQHWPSPLHNLDRTSLSAISTCAWFQSGEFRRLAAPATPRERLSPATPKIPSLTSFRKVFPHTKKIFFFLSQWIFKFFIIFHFFTFRIFLVAVRLNRSRLFHFAKLAQNSHTADGPKICFSFLHEDETDQRLIYVWWSANLISLFGALRERRFKWRLQLSISQRMCCSM